MPPSVILCVDDRPDLLIIRKAALEKCGYSVETATDAPSAIKKLENGQVAAVVVDDKRRHGLASRRLSDRAAFSERANHLAFGVLVHAGVHFVASR